MTATLTEPSAIEIRSGFDVAEVNYPKRLVTVIAMPYEQEALIEYHGRWVTEIVSRGAFNGIEERAGQIRVNRDHDWDKLVGKIVGLHPSRQEGLVTEVQIFKTDIGDRTLSECDEGGLDASAGFSLLRRGKDGPVWHDAQTWERGRTVRRLNRLHLDHLAFLPDPAYTAATVLDVRHTPGSPQEPFSDVGTPNRDRIAYLEQKAKLDELNGRWLHS